MIRDWFWDDFLLPKDPSPPPMETPDPPSDTPGTSKKVFLTPHDIPRILRAEQMIPNQKLLVTYKCMG